MRVVSKERRCFSSREVRRDLGVWKACLFSTLKRIGKRDHFTVSGCERMCVSSTGIYLVSSRCSDD